MLALLLYMGVEVSISGLISILFVNIVPVPGLTPHCFRSYSVIISFDIWWSQFPFAQGRVIIASRGWLCSERSVCRLGPGLMLGNMDFRRVPTIPELVRVVHCAETVRKTNMVHADTCSPSLWRSGILVHARQRAPLCQPQLKALGDESQSSSMVDDTSRVLSHALLG